MTGELARLREVMDTLRVKCPWDAKQTHASLLTYLIEETAEVVDAVEAGDDADLKEELGDLLLQVFFHSKIAEEQGRFNVDDVAAGIADKLIRRHPYVYAGECPPSELDGSWEQRKAAEKGRSSSLDGIPESLSSLARTQKVVTRARAHKVAIDLPEEPITAEEVGHQIQALVARAQASGVDPDAAVRQALRDLENRIRQAEG